MNEPSALNPVAIERLRELGGDKFAAEMIDLFLSYGGKKIAETRLAQQSGNLTAVAEAAHPIKSSAGNVGAARLQELAAQLEQLAGEKNIGAVAPLVDELERAFTEIKTLLEVEKSKLKPKAA